KEIFAENGIPTPKGTVIEKADDLKSIESFPVALKSQVLVGGRGKAGGIKFAKDAEEAKELLKALLELEIKGFKVNMVLAEEKIDVAKELYVGFVLDRGAGMPLLIASSYGGVEIESVPEEKLFKAHVHPLIGIQPFVLRGLVENFGEKDGAKALSKIVRSLYDIFVKYDAELVEINPLVVTKDGDFIAADAKMTIDDNSSFRHKDIKVEEDLKPLEREAKSKGISFIQLDGNIGVIANGAGLTMATLDSLNQFNGKGGVFLDLGGTDSPEKVSEAFVLMHKADPKVIFLNIFGGITKCDTVALGIRDALAEQEKKIPVVARIRGRNEEEAKKILNEAGFIATEDLELAAKKAAELGGE
ncbi:MAG: ADP-forming succinate--CoA ligase subunit beta, partial [Thermoplasmata archaeon]|nr:ADP-forming succinate--CoA ligase subunit beta [Thermoplasmata archaeon]